MIWKPYQVCILDNEMVNYFIYELYSINCIICSTEHVHHKPVYEINVEVYKA